MMFEQEEYDFENQDESNNQFIPQNNEFDQQDYEREEASQIIQYSATQTWERYYTLQNSKTKTKNIPHVLGYHFAKFMQKHIESKLLQENSLPEPLRIFLSKKVKSQTVPYGLDDFKDLFQDEVSKSWFVFYLQHNAFLDFVHSNKISNAETYILFIEHYIAGAKKPQFFKSNRTQNEKKSELKQQKQNLKRSHREQVVENNNVSLQFEQLERNVDSMNLNQQQ